MITKTLGTVALTSLMLVGMAGGAVAAAASADGTLPNAAYFVVNLHYCSPTQAPETPMPAGDAAIVYEEVLMGTHDGDCEAFNVNEVLPRLHLHDGT